MGYITGSMVQLHSFALRNCDDTGYKRANLHDNLKGPEGPYVQPNDRMVLWLSQQRSGWLLRTSVCNAAG
jgi:hypothetical protein